MKTLKEIKDEVAKDVGYHDYKTALSLFQTGAISAFAFSDFLDELMLEVAKESLNNASKRDGCTFYENRKAFPYVAKELVLDKNNIPKL